MGIFSKVYFLFLAVSVMVAPTISFANENSKAPVVLELFTSQSCSSCPSADKVLQEFSGEPHVIALGYHVTYWNHLDWEDTLSSGASTLLQNEFNASLGSNRVYTPQMVVNGQDEFVGSKRGKVAHHVENISPVISIPVTLKERQIIADIPTQFSKTQNLSLMIVGFDKDVTQSITDGENSGEVVSYTHPVKTIQYIQDWKNGHQTIDIPEPHKSSGGYAMIIREGRAGKIIAAGQIRL